MLLHASFNLGVIGISKYALPFFSFLLLPLSADPNQEALILHFSEHQPLFPYNSLLIRAWSEEPIVFIESIEWACLALQTSWCFSPYYDWQKCPIPIWFCLGRQHRSNVDALSMCIWNSLFEEGLCWNHKVNVATGNNAPASNSRHKGLPSMSSNSWLTYLYHGSKFTTVL